MKKAEHLLITGLHPSEVIKGYELASTKALSELESTLFSLCLHTKLSNLPPELSKTSLPSPLTQSSLAADQRSLQNSMATKTFSPVSPQRQPWPLCHPIQRTSTSTTLESSRSWVETYQPVVSCRAWSLVVSQKVIVSLALAFLVVQCSLFFTRDDQKHQEGKGCSFYMCFGYCPNGDQGNRFNQECR